MKPWAVPPFSLTGGYIVVVEFIVVGSFVVITLGMIIREKLARKQPPAPRPGEEAEWFYAIK